MQLFWDDVKATSMYTIEAFEAYTHYYTLKRYLDTVDYRPITDKDIVALREKDRQKTYDNETRELVKPVATEHFASQFFGGILRAVRRNRF